MKKLLFASVLLSLCTIFAAPAHAWDCPSGQQRVQAPAGTPTTAPYYDVVEGIAFICEPITPPTTPTTPSTSTSNSTSSANAASNSSSNSASNSSSNQTQKQGQKQTQTANGGSATSTATGGQGGSATVGPISTTSSVSNSGNSTLKNSGNSSNKNTNTATGGDQSQSATATATGNGDNSNNYTNITNVPRDVATATAPVVLPTVPCFKGYSGGAQGTMFGVSFGGGKIDDNCARLEVARMFGVMGNDVAFCKVMLTNKYVKDAGVDMEMCLVPLYDKQDSAVRIAPVVPPAPVFNFNVSTPAPVVTVIPAPAAPVAPSVAEAAAKTKHKSHVPCEPQVVPSGKKGCTVTNDSIKQ